MKKKFDKALADTILDGLAELPEGSVNCKNLIMYPKIPDKIMSGDVPARFGGDAFCWIAYFAERPSHMLGLYTRREGIWALKYLLGSYTVKGVFDALKKCGISDPIEITQWEREPYDVLRELCSRAFNYRHQKSKQRSGGRVDDCGSLENCRPA